MSKRSISSLSVSGKLLKLVRSDRVKDSPRRYMSNGSLPDLLQDSTSILGLSSKAKAAFTEDGTRITSLDEVPPGSIITIATNQSPSPSKSKTSPLKSPRSPKLSPPLTPNKSPKKNEVIRSIKHLPEPDSISTISEAKTVVVEGKAETPYSRYHQLLINIPGTANDHVKYSLLSGYCSIPKEFRSKVKKHDEIQRIYIDSRTTIFEKILGDNLIFSPSNEFDTIAKEAFNEKKIGDIKYIVLGPRGSGKTAVLSRLASCLHLKLISSADCESYLAYPINLSRLILYLNDPIRQYNLLIENFVKCLLECRFDLFGVIPALRSWFLSVTTAGTLASPPQVMKNLGIDTDELSKILKHILTAFRKHDADFEKIIQIPLKLTKAFKFTQMVLVADHIDCLPPDSQKHFYSIMNKCPFVAAVMEESSPIPISYTPLYTDDISDKTDKRIIEFSKWTLSYDECMGLPTALDLFVQAADLIETVPKPKLGMPRPAANGGKITIARQLLLKLCSILTSAGSPTITSDAMNALYDDVKISVKTV